MESGSSEAPSPPAEYPTLVRRYFATLLDGMLLFTFFFVLAYLLPGDSAAALRATIIVVALFLYEPLCCARVCTAPLANGSRGCGCDSSPV
jgi:hypothetical protein